MPNLIEISPEISFLIIDEHQTFRDAIRHSLKNLGFQNIYQAIDARAALNTLKNNSIGFIICERHLSKVSGMEFLKEIREMKELPHIPFIMMSSDISKEDIFLASEFGIDGFLKKPFVLKDITNKISIALQHFNNPNNKETLFEEARILFAKEQFNDALTIYQKILKELPNSARVRVGIAKCLKQLQRYEEAEQILLEAIDKKDTYVHAYHELGILNMELSKIEKAIKYFNKAIELSPGNPIRYERVSDVLMRKEKFSDAENYLRKAVKLELVYPELYAQLGKALFAQKKLDRALQYFEKAVKDDPKNSSFLNSIGICKKEAGKYEDAIHYYNLALKEIPGDTKIMFNKVLCYIQMKELNKAKKMCEQILKIDPNYEKAKQKIGEILKKSS